MKEVRRDEMNHLIAVDDVAQDEVDEQEGEDEGVDNGIHQTQENKEEHCGQRAVVWQRQHTVHQGLFLFYRVPLHEIQHQTARLQNLQWHARPPCRHYIRDEKIRLHIHLHISGLYIHQTLKEIL